jgi:anti-sigma factor RsiW
MTAHLACAELVELVTDYLQRRLPERERARFEEHLAGCPGCAAHVEQARTTVRLAGRLSADDLSPAARESLLAAFRGWNGRG